MRGFRNSEAAHPFDVSPLPEWRNDISIAQSADIWCMSTLEVDICQYVRNATINFQIESRIKENSIY